MSDTLDKVIEKIPYFDGGFRRRITSGAILVSLIYLFSQDFKNPELLKLASGNISVLIVIFLIIYAVGSLIELVSDVFVSRIIEVFTRIKVLPGHNGKSINLEKLLGEQGLSYFHNLPPAVKYGLEYPFGKYRESAWSYFCTSGTSSEIDLARKLRARNQDVLVIVTSITISIFIISFPYFQESVFGSYGKFSQEQSQEQYVQAVWYIAVMFIFAAASVFPLIFFVAYLSSVKNSILTLLEYRAFDLATSITEKHNKRIQVTPESGAPDASRYGKKALRNK